ncbi:MAG: pyridoxamine 5'-phosphate oxidase family protein [Arenicellales bacterium]
MTDKLLTPNAEKISEAHDFYHSFSSIILSTVSENGQPHSSYAPHICHDHKLYVFVSGLAQHSATLANGAASVFLVEDESKAKTVFARKRLTLQIHSARIAPESPHYSKRLDQFEAEHGATIKMLRSLPDFVLFELQPSSALFVTGFGATYDVMPFLENIIKND